MSGQLPTVIPGLSAIQFAARLADNYPRGWCSDDAKYSPPGNIYALLLSLGQQLQVVQGELQYTLAAQRIQTETFPELDFASIDFLGDALPRAPGTTDVAFGQAIIAALFQPAATRPALQNALTELTGTVPRMLEPWSVNDTGAWRNKSYWGVDTVANPARWGNGGLRYQGYIETAPPAIPAIGANNPIRCWGNSAYWNVAGYFFGIIAPADVNAIDDLVVRLKAEGTVIWMRIVTPAAGTSVTAPNAVTNLVAVAAGANSVLLSWVSPTVGTPPFTSSVLYRQTGTQTFTSGPTVTANTATVQNLAPGIEYDFEIVVRNTAGAAASAIVSASTSLVPPAPAQNLIATQVQATAVTLAWQQPVTGTPPFTYSVNYRITGTTIWQTFTVGQGALAVTVINLVPLTQYDFEVVTTNL
jgi:hypothetical protein